MKKITIFLSICMLLILSACSGETSKDSIKVIKFADAGWDSIRVHNSIAQLIVEEGYGYDTEVTSGTTAATFSHWKKGILMSIWNYGRIISKKFMKQQLKEEIL